MSLTLKSFDFAFYCILLYFILLHYLMYHKITNIDSSSNNIDYYKFYSFPLSSFMPIFLYHIQRMCFFLQCPYISFRFPLIVWFNIYLLKHVEKKRLDVMMELQEIYLKIFDWCFKQSLHWWERKSTICSPWLVQEEIGRSWKNTSKRIYNDTGYFPTIISKSFVQYCFYGDVSGTQ